MPQQILSQKMIDVIARSFRTLGEPFRLRILQELEIGEKSVGELVESLNGNQSNVSKHLRILFDAGLITRRRNGTSIVYSISDPMVFKLCALVCHSETEKSRRELKELASPFRGKRP